MLLGWARRWLRAGAVGLPCVAMGWASVALAQATRLVPTPPNTQYFTTRTIITTDGTSFEQMVINGPPTPPPGYPIESSLAALPAPQPEAGINTITVPAYEWTFGCSATSGAMIAAYYDRNGFPNIYTGPTNGGVMPPGQQRVAFTVAGWKDGAGTYAQCPLAASHNGLDGRATRGSIDDY